ncbi:response regulator transcription factor [Salinarimonas sp.]|uniref:response regulator transcription factor n=1 Tax=Salinarimonas sp. TaxID=2766526 RepID=UPI0039187C6E
MDILVVEDDPRVADFLERGLRAEGYRVRRAVDGHEGLRQARALAQELDGSGATAIVVLDLMLPGMSGLEVCQCLRATRVDLPILMLTAMSDARDRVAGLRMGADDYLGKPFDFEELLARIEALARRAGRGERPAARLRRLGCLTFDPSLPQARLDGVELDLTATELALLELLMSSPEKVFSRERILANVWGVDRDPLTNVVDVYIARLRRKIAGPPDAPRIETVRRLGYRLRAP